MKKKSNMTIFGLSLVIIIMSIEPISAGFNHKEMLPEKTQGTGDNIVADITVTWDSFLRRFSLKDLEPIVTINQSEMKDFYFPEVNGIIQKINFTVTCKHRLNHRVLFPRFTQVYISVYLLNGTNKTYLLSNESINNPCKSLEWESINFTAESSKFDEPLETNGENMTLYVIVGAYYFFFFRYWGAIEDLEPITIHPIPTD